MENFNKNWLAIIIIAVVFFLLGLLLGKVSSHHPHMMPPGFHNGCHKHHDFDFNDDENEISVDVDVEKILDELNLDDVKSDSNIVVIKKIIK